MNTNLNVYLCGSKIGVLYEDELSQLSFRYTSIDLASRLSVNLPVRTEEYPHTYIYPFLENLTPEGEAFGILTKSHVSGNKIFSFLDKFGGDCAGAVSFYKTEPVNTDKVLQEIPSSKLTYIIDKLPEDPLLTSLENPPRLSLAGAQSKFAVHKIDLKYYRSDDEHPTTHIIKIANTRFPDLLINELFNMKLAQIIQLDASHVELEEIQGRQYLEIKRYDRYIEKGNIFRIHQEDFCQALGIVSSKKYQTGGGANLKNCLNIIKEHSNNPLSDISRFIEWIIFNYLIGNTDAHAKNLSLLHTKTGIKLAPFYDLLSTEIYSEKIVDHNMAMLINGKGKYKSLKLDDFIMLFEQLGLNATNLMKSLKNKFSGIIPIAENLRDSNKFLTENKPICNNIITIIKKRMSILFPTP